MTGQNGGITTCVLTLWLLNILAGTNILILGVLQNGEYTHDSV